MRTTNATSAAGIAAPSTEQIPELGHLKAAAERIAAANYNLATFHNRFFGIGAAGESADAAETAPGYRNDLNAVFEQISLLETLVNDLTRIG